MAWNKWILTILALIILVLVFWPTLIGAAAGQWVVAIAAIVIIILTWFGGN